MEIQQKDIHYKKRERMLSLKKLSHIYKMTKIKSAFAVTASYLFYLIAEHLCLNEANVSYQNIGAKKE